MSYIFNITKYIVAACAGIVPSRWIFIQLYNYYRNRHNRRETELLELLTQKQDLEPDYKHEPLRGPESKEIRLIELLLDWSIRVRITSLAGPDVTEFEALSYFWGDSTKLLPLRCHEASGEYRTIWIQVNLAHALRKLRLQDRARILWADAICINQADLNEKAWQVQMMADIYRNATQVLIFLGQEDIADSTFLDSIPSLLQAKERVDAAMANGTTWEDISSNDVLWREFGIPSGFHMMSIFKAMCHFLKKPWLRRVWVIQELILAKHASVICGDRVFPWESLVRAFKWLKIAENLTGLGYGFAIYTDTHRIEELEESKTLQGDESYMENWLAYHRGTLATNPVDHIFALVGLANDGKSFTVNYQKSVLEVYGDAARYILQRPRGQRLLNFAGTCQRTDPSLPSWVPDWRSPMFSSPLAFNFPLPTDPHKDAKIGGDTTVVCAGNNLRVMGSIIGTIALMGACAPKVSPDLKTRDFEERKLQSVFAEWVDTLGTKSFKLYDLVNKQFREKLGWPQFPDQYSNFNQAQFECFQGQCRLLKAVMSLPLPFDSILGQLWGVALFNLLEMIVSAYYSIRGKGTDNLYLGSVCFGRRMIYTECGHIGLGPPDTKVGDNVFLLQGAIYINIWRRMRKISRTFILLSFCNTQISAVRYSVLNSIPICRKWVRDKRTPGKL